MPRWIIGTISAFVVLGLLGVAAWRGYHWLREQSVPAMCYVSVDGQEIPQALTEEQAGNAAIIVAVSFQRELPERAAIVALATAWQESSLRNLDYGDADSLGLFQQRPSQGWGSEDEIMDPWYSAAKFYEELVKFDGWETTDVNDMAQKVQRSAYPEAYRKHEANSRALAGALRGTRPASLACTGTKESTLGVSPFVDVVAAVPGVEVVQDNQTVRITAEDSTRLWAATHMAMTHTLSAGIHQATVGQWQWTGQFDSTWNNDGDGEAS
ncbi:MAG: hypothetical protein ACK5KO_04430, partial [Arachnia sp.]